MGPSAALFLQHGVQMVILEHHRALKQRSAHPHFAPALHHRQRRVFVPAHYGPLLANLAQPQQQWCAWIHPYPQRQRVEKQPNDSFRTFDCGKTIAANNSKNYVCFAAVATQQQRPRALHDGIEGKLIGLGQRTQGRGNLRRQDEFARSMSGPALVGGIRCMIDNQRRGRGKALERLTPERLIFAEILLLYPVDVVPIGSGQRQGHFATATKCFIKREYFP